MRASVPLPVVSLVLLLALLVGTVTPDAAILGDSAGWQQCGCGGMTSLHVALCPSSEEAREALKDVSGAVMGGGACSSRPRHCQDLRAAGDSGRGVRQVYPRPDRPLDAVTVFCDHTVDGGGWTVFQRRTNADPPRQDFYRTWVEYQLGFGRLEGEVWLGLDLLHAITSLALHQLRVELVDYEGNRRWAKYDVFHVGPAADNYRLSVGRYSGDAGDSLSRHNAMQFSTYDAEHDVSDEKNCALAYRGAWWYEACHSSNLNGYQYVAHHSSYADGINWEDFKGYHYSLMNTTMMVKPAF